MKDITVMHLLLNVHRKFHATKCLFDDVHVCWLKGNQYEQGLLPCWVDNLQNQTVPIVIDWITAAQSATSILPET